MNPDSKIYVTEASNFLGSAILQKLKTNGFQNIITEDTLNLEHSDSVEKFFTKQGPDVVFLAIGPSAGIQGNIERPAELMYSNLIKGLNIVSAAYKSKVRQLIYIASSCVYPREISQPMKESSLLTGPFEPTNEAYAMAKLATLKLCEAYNSQYKTNFLSVIPANPYGPMDSFEGENAHVITALIGKMHANKTAATLPIWGSGKAIRDFLYVDDLAEAAIFLATHTVESKTINVSSGQVATIAELAEMIKETVGFQGKLIFDINRPEGMPKKTVDGSQIQKMGWKSKTSLREGIQKTYQWYLENVAHQA